MSGKKQEQLSKRLLEIQGRGKNRKEIELHVKIGVIENTLLNNLCQMLGINKSRFTRIAIGFYASYIDSLDNEGLKKELMKIIHFA